MHARRLAGRGVERNARIGGCRRRDDHSRIFRMPSSGLLYRRECLVPTWRGWLALLVVLALAAFAFVRGIHGFLAVRDFSPGGMLVVEGWAPDHALVETLAEFRRAHYDGICVTGVPIEHGEPLSEYRTYAELSAAILVRLGADPKFVHAVPAGVVRQDRTYATAVALRSWLGAHRASTAKVNIVSLGAHSRRTWLLYEKAFGPATKVGIIAIPPRDYDPARWWRSSQGVRVVISEVIGWLYARFLFHPRQPG